MKPCLLIPVYDHGDTVLGRPPSLRDSFRQYFQFGLVALDRLRFVQCPVGLLIGLRRSARRYDVFVERLREPALATPAGRRAWATEVVADYARRLERLCLRAPYQWFNFFDFWDEDSRSRKPVVA